MKGSTKVNVELLCLTNSDANHARREVDCHFMLMTSAVELTEKADVLRA